MMKTLKSIFAIFLFVSLLFSGCSGCWGEQKTKEEKEMEELEENLNKAGENLEKIIKSKTENLEDDLEKATEDAGNKIKELNNVEDVELVNFRDLKKKMPKELLGMTRVKHEGSTNGVMGMEISTAKAKYKAGDRSLEIDIIDAGGIGQAFIGMAAWSKLKVDEESDRGYKKTTTFDGHKSLEQCDNIKKECQLNLISGDRFIFNLVGENISIDDLKKVLKSLKPGDMG